MKCNLICLLILCCGFASDILALRCASADGLSVEDVRKGRRELNENFVKYCDFEIIFPVVRKCMKKVTQSDSDAKSYDEYKNFDNDYETSNRRDSNREDTSRSSSNYDHARPNTFSNSFNPRTNQHYDPQAGGNYNDLRPDSNPYQHTYNDNNNFNNRNNNFHGSQNNNDGRRNDSTSTNDKHEKERACILQCFFQELKIVRRWSFIAFFLFPFCAMIRDWRFLKDAQNWNFNLKIQIFQLTLLKRETNF